MSKTSVKKEKEEPPNPHGPKMVRANCYSGLLRNTPAQVAKGIATNDRALPGASQSYYAQRMVKNLSESKQSHLDMCNNFIPHDRWHELAVYARS